MATNSLPVLLQRFFDHLRNTEDVSPHTASSYRDALRLLLHFIAKQRRITVDQISLDSFQPEIILAFLEHLQKERHNTVRTRNVRLAGLRAFMRFCLSEVEPEFVGIGQRILSIPCKRTSKPVLGFLSIQEVKAILAATDQSKWTGRRDHLLFSLLYNTGARISEALRVTPDDVEHRVVRLHGKGRKQRDVPLWKQTHREIQRWGQDNQIQSSQPLFGNPDRRPLSRRAAARRMTLTLRQAERACPSLRGRRITLHTWRHTCAVHLLQAGVPIELIALWLGHEQVGTTHGYLEADLTLKKQILDHLKAPTPWRQVRTKARSHILAILDSLK